MAKKAKRMSFSFTDNAGAMVNRLGFGKDANLYFAKTLLKCSIPYTPKLSGELRAGARVTATNYAGYIEYPGIVYADYQFFSDDSLWDRHTPGTTSRWTDYAWMVHKDYITRAVGGHIGGKR